MRLAQTADNDFSDEGTAVQWVTSSLSFLRQVFGSDSDYFLMFQSSVRTLDDISVADALGVLRAAKEDYERGYLFNLRQLVNAEVFDDFLGQAEHLLSNGYFQPSAVVAGSVLEDGLRKLCDRNKIALPDKPKLDTMNANLAKAGVYNKLAQKNVTAWADLRNKAAHGQWDQFTRADVEGMLHGVRHFMSDHFT